MRLAVVIPTYWGRPRAEGWKPGDAVYDHPTPLDEEGTLARTLESLKRLQGPEYTLVILAVPTTDEIAEAVEQKVREIVQRARPAVPTVVFGPSDLARMMPRLQAAVPVAFQDLLQLRGYSPVRNLCLFVPHVLGAEAAVLVDDDEVVEDPEFLQKAVALLGREYQGVPVYAVAGYYLNADGSWRVDRPYRPWRRYWDKFDRMNEAFERFIGEPPRYKITPFVFGGNMAVHKHLMMRVPFDPAVPRGEDMDFLINARIFGYAFFLDRELAIKHLPPPKPHPLWRQLREDVYRFVRERAKLRALSRYPHLFPVRPEDLDPYPGAFLKDDLEEKVIRSHTLLAQEYLAEGKAEDARETLKTLELLETDAPPREDPVKRLLDLQARWSTLMQQVDTPALRQALQETLTVLP